MASPNTPQKITRFVGPSGQVFNAQQLAQGAALVRRAGGDAAFAKWADTERALNKQGKTQLGAPKGSKRVARY